MLVCVCARCEKRTEGEGSPAERPEPGQVVGVVHTVANGDDLLEALDLDTHHLHKETVWVTHAQIHTQC